MTTTKFNPVPPKKRRGMGSTVDPVIVNQIITTANSQGLDPGLALAVANTESAFNPNAKSSAGAIGLFQLMPGTAQGLGVDPYNTNQNILGGVTYLRQLLNQFGGNTSLALAAYNAGSGAVQKYNGIPPYAETQAYVAKINSSLSTYQDMASNYTPVDSSGTVDSSPTGNPINDVTGYFATTGIVADASATVDALVSGDIVGAWGIAGSDVILSAGLIGTGLLLVYSMF